MNKNLINILSQNELDELLSIFDNNNEKNEILSINLNYIDLILQLKKIELDIILIILKEVQDNNFELTENLINTIKTKLNLKNELIFKYINNLILKKIILKNDKI